VAKVLIGAPRVLRPRFAAADDDADVGDLVAERRQMGAELRALREAAAGVPRLDDRRSSKSKRP
jgi:hypothetical protein